MASVNVSSRQKSQNPVSAGTVAKPEQKSGLNPIISQVLADVDYIQWCNIAC
jgi:hypothetical protein